MHGITDGLVGEVKPIVIIHETNSFPGRDRASGPALGLFPTPARAVSNHRGKPNALCAVKPLHSLAVDVHWVDSPEPDSWRRFEAPPAACVRARVQIRTLVGTGRTGVVPGTLPAPIRLYYEIHGSYSAQSAAV